VSAPGGLLSAGSATELEKTHLCAKWTCKAMMGAGICITKKDNAEIEMNLDIDKESICDLQEFV
jgi:hypothetical protein